MSREHASRRVAVSNMVMFVCAAWWAAVTLGVTVFGNRSDLGAGTALLFVGAVGAGLTGEWDRRRDETSAGVTAPSSATQERVSSILG